MAEKHPRLIGAIIYEVRALSLVKVYNCNLVRGQIVCDMILSDYFRIQLNVSKRKKFSVIDYVRLKSFF